MLSRASCIHVCKLSFLGHVCTAPVQFWSSTMLLLFTSNCTVPIQKSSIYIEGAKVFWSSNGQCKRDCDELHFQCRGFLKLLKDHYNGDRLTRSQLHLNILQVSSESNYLWMKSLVSFQKAENSLMEQCTSQAKTLEQLTLAFNYYQEGLIDLKVGWIRNNFVLSLVVTFGFTLKLGKVLEVNLR